MANDRKQITSWSFSRWTTWSTCPARAKYKFIDRLPEPQGPAASRGDEIGKLADKYVAGAIKKLPDELKHFKSEFSGLRKAKAQTQLSIAFTKQWDPCSPTDWDHAWVRMQVDVLVPPRKNNNQVMHIIDNKTGRIRSEDYTPQLELYGIGGFIRYPQATVARTNLYFLDHGVIIGADATAPYKPSGIYKQKDLSKLKKKWEARVRPMLEATAFPPMPGNHCRWCSFRKSNGGPCKF